MPTNGDDRELCYCCKLPVRDPEGLRATPLEVQFQSIHCNVSGCGPSTARHRKYTDEDQQTCHHNSPNPNNLSSSIPCCVKSCSGPAFAALPFLLGIFAVFTSAGWSVDGLAVAVAFFAEEVLNQIAWCIVSGEIHTSRSAVLGSRF